VIAAVDAVASGAASNAFCAIRPPGHHAEQHEAMGFCFFNNVAIGAAHAHAVHGFQRVAVVDFDVHHGNGTQAMFAANSHMFFISTHQWPFYPGTGARNERGAFNNILNIPLPAGHSGQAFRNATMGEILSVLTTFSPDFLLISAGFDAHENDPLGGLNLNEDDFYFITKALVDFAAKQCGGRVVSTLEGGYDLPALGASAAAHVRALMSLPPVAGL